MAKLSNRLRVLYLAPVEPWCRENGSSVITADLVDALTRNESIEMLPVFLRHPPSGYDKKPPADDIGVQLGLEGLPRWASVARALALQSSPMRVRFANGRAARRILEVVRARNFQPEVIHVEHLPLVDIGLQLARVFRAPLVYRAHNIEAQLWSRRLGVGGRLGEAIAKYLAKSEAAAIRACDLTLGISDVDLAWMRVQAPDARAELLPPALLVERYESAQPRHRVADMQIAFIGGLEWTPNEVGLRWFVDEVLPLVLKRIPNARLAVLARGAAERPWLTENAAITMLPPEADAPSLFASSDVSLAPLLQGGGVRIKILESLAIGCPVVATNIGGEGLQLPGLTKTDDPVAFATACVTHLEASANEALRARQRSAVNEQHGAAVVADRLVHNWMRLSRHSFQDERVAYAV
ncbi:MAG TPA: glycosyltransferase [Longimicrobiales bacterium]